MFLQMQQGMSFTIQDRKYNSDGTLDRIDYIEGHMNQKPIKDSFNSESEYNEYMG